MLPNLAFWHPQIVHFVIALLIVGVILRLVSLTGRFAFTGPAAATLLFLGAGSAVLAVKSGTDAHGPVERMPGVRTAVQEHEDAGHDTRNVFLVVAALELVALGLGQRPARRWVLIASGVVGLAGLWPVYRVGMLGGELVYKYAGGVGTHYGDSSDVGRLVMAGLYQQGMADRAAKRPDAAALAFADLAAQFPDDPTVQLLHAQSLLTDKKDGQGALAVLAGITVPQDNRMLRLQYDYAKADAYVATGAVDSARATLQALSQAFADNPRMKQRIEQRIGQLGKQP
jgi:uncharacterized membrane protein